MPKTTFFADRSAGAEPTIFRDVAGDPMLRSLETVRDFRLGDIGALRPASEVLDALDAPALALLRRDGFLARRDGAAPLFRCGFCDGPVHIRVRGVAASGETGGRRAAFVHDPRPAARDCPYGSLTEGLSASAIDAKRFAGRQEGRRHRFLKGLLANALRSDPAFQDVYIEQRIRHGVDWRVPDVSAATDYGTLGFDVQLAAPLLNSICGRQSFYAGAGVGHLWIVDAADPERLSLQGFQDVVFAQGSAVLGFDESCASASARSGELMLQLMTLHETRGGSFSVESEWLGRDLILDLAGLRRPDAPPIAGDLRAAALFQALAEGDTDALRLWFDALRDADGATGWAAAEADGLPGLIGTLATLVTGRKADASGFGVGEVNAVVNLVLRRDQPGLRSNRLGRAWAPVLARAGYRAEIRARIDKPGTATRRLLDQALAECAADPAPSQALIARWGCLLDRLFPGLRLASLTWPEVF